MTRAVLFDTETTGFYPEEGDRVIEIAAIELSNDLPTGEKFYAQLDPERDIPTESTRIHGITSAHVHGKPKFADVADEMLAFFGDDPLIAHNAPFDFGFLDAELARLNKPKLPRERMIDTLVIAKKIFPGMPNSLDALCTRYGIDRAERTTHNALLDCKLLAAVYVELTGGRQRGFVLDTDQRFAFAKYARPADYVPIRIELSPEQLAAHAAFISRIKDAIWTHQ
jgi:DNA polymerase-3 subunit epsilon